MQLHKKYLNVLKHWLIPGLSRGGWINNVTFILFWSSYFPFVSNHLKIFMLACLVHHYFTVYRCTIFFLSGRYQHGTQYLHFPACTHSPHTNAICQIKAHDQNQLNCTRLLSSATSLRLFNLQTLLTVIRA
jgi:hypothetical protein